MLTRCARSLVLKRDFEKTRAEEHDDDVHLGTFTCLPSTPCELMQVFSSISRADVALYRPPY